MKYSEVGKYGYKKIRKENRKKLINLSILILGVATVAIIFYIWNQ